MNGRWWGNYYKGVRGDLGGDVDKLEDLRFNKHSASDSSPFCILTDRAKFCLNLFEKKKRLKKMFWQEQYILLLAKNAIIVIMGRG